MNIIVTTTTILFIVLFTLLPFFITANIFSHSNYNPNRRHVFDVAKEYYFNTTQQQNKKRKRHLEVAAHSKVGMNNSTSQSTESFISPKWNPEETSSSLSAIPSSATMNIDSKSGQQQSHYIQGDESSNDKTNMNQQSSAVNQKRKLVHRCDSIIQAVHENIALFVNSNRNGEVGDYLLYSGQLMGIPLPGVFNFISMSYISDTITPGDNRFYIDGTFVFTEGQITFAGPTTNVEEDSTERAIFAITGGTGAFAGVGGYCQYQFTFDPRFGLSTAGFLVWTFFPECPQFAKKNGYY